MTTMKANAVTGDVVEKFEEGEGFEEQDEGTHDDGEVVKEAAKEIEVHDSGETGEGGRNGFAVAAEPF